MISEAEKRDAAVVRLARLTEAEHKDAARFEWVLPIVTAQGEEGDRRALALAAQFLRGLDGREAIDAAMKDGAL